MTEQCEGNPGNTAGRCRILQIVSPNSIRTCNRMFSRVHVFERTDLQEETANHISPCPKVSIRSLWLIAPGLLGPCSGLVTGVWGGCAL